MKVESGVKPKGKYRIEKGDNKTFVIFFDNVREEKRITEEGIEEKIYVYNEYKKEINIVDNLEDRINSNLEVWLDDAKQLDYNNKATLIRKKRDKLLTETDWTRNDDNNLTVEEREHYKIYRQLLRDITKQDTFPESVEWPVI